jgi:hypothetical protein
MEIPGRVQNGVVVLENGSSLPDGTEVKVSVCDEAVRARDAMTAEERRRYLRALARIDAVPNENPGDTFGGAEHDRVLYGEAG